MLPVPSQLDTDARLTLSVLVELALCFLLVSLSLYLAGFSRIQSQISLATKTTEQSFGSQTLEFFFKNLFSLSLMMVSHLDNASVLVDSLLSGFGWRFLQSYPLIHSFCELLEVKALFKWIRISAYYCKQFSSPCDFGCVPSFISGEQSNQANDKARQAHLGSFISSTMSKLNCPGQPLFTPCFYWVLSAWMRRRSHFVHCSTKYISDHHLKHLVRVNIM